MNTGVRSGVIAIGLLAAMLAANGCASHSRRSGGPSSQPAGGSADPRAELAFDQIEPSAGPLPQRADPTQAAPPPSLDAVQAYAQARSKLVDHQWFAAVRLLERAAALDPNSFEVQFALGKALLNNATPASRDQALEALEKAAAIDPDNLELQYMLGRQYLAKEQVAKALLHLRQARLTGQYQEDPQSDEAILADYLLSVALQQSGYLRAALEQTESVMQRLQQPPRTYRHNGDVAYRAQHMEDLYRQIAEIQERRGNLDAALTAYGQALSCDPESTDLTAQVARVALLAGHADVAKQRAGEAVVRTHASPESLELLKQVWRQCGDEGGAVGVLTQLHKQNPKDRSLLTALLDTLKRSGRAEEAERLLVQASSESRSDPDLTRRLFALYQERNDVESAMRLLVRTLADRPDSLREIGPLWLELMKPARRTRLRLPVLQKMQVPPNEEAARLYWVSRIAEVWNRDALSRSALQRAAAVRPPFAPVFRLLIAEYWGKPDWDDPQKIAECQKLIDDVASQGDAALAAELRGRSLFNQNKPADAAKAFADAIEKGNRSPDLRLMQARAVAKSGNDVKAEQMLWSLVGDWPQYEEAYGELFSTYLERHSAEQALNVLRKWLDADSSSVDARLLEATIYAQANRADALAAAHKVLDDLFAEQPGNLRVLLAMRSLYGRDNKVDAFIQKLQEERARHPENREALEMLVQLYAEQKRVPDASRVLDEARGAVAKDPDLLYYVAHLYERIDQRATMLNVLEEVVRMDPNHAAASNDLGYTWADEGKQLDRAESLIRVAVEAEPDNQSYLDSMGWVEYKRSKFAEARDYLERAIGPANRPDPVVLDHMGDTLYRLDRAADAAKQWKRSLQRIDELESDRDDLKQLRLQLIQKLQQHQQGHPVNVAPTVEGSSAIGKEPGQAGNYRSSEK